MAHGAGICRGGKLMIQPDNEDKPFMVPHNMQADSRTPWIGKNNDSSFRCFGIIPQRNAMPNQMTKPSFAVDRTRHGSFIDQMTDALKSAIESGCYKPGDVLPTLEQLAAEGGVSLYIPRAAVKRLTDEGYVVPRPGIGSVVLERTGRVWRGHVIIVTRGIRDGLSFSTVVAFLRTALIEAGYLVTHIAVPADLDTQPDYSQLDLLLRQSLSLVVVVGDGYGVGAHIADSGVPVVTTGHASHGPAGAIAHIRTDFRPAFKAFAAHCRERKVRTAAFFWFGGKDILPEVLREAGIKVDVRRVECVPRIDGRGGLDDIERMTRGTMEHFESWFSESRYRLPDVLCFTDDNAAGGALTALQHHGVRVPEDVGFVSLSLTGIGPVFWKTLTRFELDPCEAGRNVADAVLAFLAGKRIRPRRNVVRYIHGDTFP